MGVYHVSFEAPKIPFRPNQCSNCKNYKDKNCTAYTERRPAFGTSTVTLGANFEGESEDPCPRYESNWEPANPDLPIGLPPSALEHIFVFADYDKDTILGSPGIKSALQDAAGMHFDDMSGRIPIDAIEHSKVTTQIIETQSIPESAWDAMSTISSSLVKKGRQGLGKIEVRVLKDSTIIMFYRT